MTRDAVLWGMIISLLIPCLTLGWFRGRAIGRAYRAIYADLKKAGTDLSKADLQLLIGQLNRNPRAVLETESSPEVRAIKQQHVESLLEFTRFYRRCFYVIVAVGVVAVVSFPHLWPKQ
jgi:hypothetical protein